MYKKEGVKKETRGKEKGGRGAICCFPPTRIGEEGKSISIFKQGRRLC